MPDALIIGRGAAWDEAQRLGLDGVCVDSDALVLVEADGTVLLRRDAPLETLRPAHLLLAPPAVPRVLPIPGWTLAGVTSLAEVAPGAEVWVAGFGAMVAEAVAALPAGTVAGTLDLATVTGLRAEGEDRLRAIRFRRDGVPQTVAATGLVLHDGCVPDVQMTRALGCAHGWDAAQGCWVAQVDDWGATSRAGVWAACGGAASSVRAARGVARALGRSGLTPVDVPAAAGWSGRVVRAEDETVICPCEAVTAGAVRAAGRAGCLGLNQLKVFTRCGMGPCQGRRCGALAAGVLAEALGVPVVEVAPMQVRFPLGAVALGALGALEDGV